MTSTYDSYAYSFTDKCTIEFGLCSKKCSVVSATYNICLNSCKTSQNSCRSSGGMMSGTHAPPLVIKKGQPQIDKKQEQPKSNQWSAPKKPNNNPVIPTTGNKGLPGCESIEAEARSNRSAFCQNNNSNSRCHKDVRDIYCQNSSTNESNDSRIDNEIVSAAQTCLNKIQNSSARCGSELTKAKGSCDQENEEMAQLGNMAAQATQGLGAQNAGSIAGACSKTASLVSGANAALAAWRINCKSDRDDCLSTCTQVRLESEDCAEDYGKSIATRYGSPNAIGFKNNILDVMKEGDPYVTSVNARKECNAMQTKINEAENAIVNYAATLRNAQNCSEATSASLPDYCKTNPTSFGCKAAESADCTNPANASSMICVCQKNPMDPMCKGGNSGKNGFNNVGAPNSSATGSAAKIDASSFSSSGDEEISVNGEAPASTAGDQGGGSGGSGIGGGSSSGGGAMPGSEGEYASEESPGVNAGFYGSGIGGGSGNNGSGGDGSVNPGEPGSADLYNGVNGAPDLRKFLPDGSLNPRYGIGMAGMTGPDGITGPHTNIWHKINNRYKEKEETLIKK